MSYSEDIPVVFENGVFRPERPLNIPERARLRISIREREGAATSGVSLKEMFNHLRAKGVVRSAGWRPTRDELHERG